MMIQPPSACKDFGLVPLVRPADALGAALRTAFAAPPLPAELVELLRRLDARANRH